jgi:hypothetical protein
MFSVIGSKEKVIGKGYEDGGAGTRVVYRLFIISAGTRVKTALREFGGGCFYSIIGIMMDSVFSCPFSLNSIGV